MKTWVQEGNCCIRVAEKDEKGAAWGQEISDQILIAKLHKYKSVPSPRVENNKRAYTASLPEDDGTTPEPKKILDGREPSPASLML